MPRVVRFSIAPVPRVGLEDPEAIELTDRGVLEDRRFFLAAEKNRLGDKLVIPTLSQITTHTDPDATHLRMTFPDGTVVEDDVRLTDAIEIAIHGRNGVGHIVDGPWAAPLSAFTGRPITLIRCDQPGGTRTGNAVSLVGDGSLSELARRANVDAVDARRFRMLIELDGTDAHEEDSWIGTRIALGTAELMITKPDSRCAMPPQNPDPGDG